MSVCEARRNKQLTGLLAVRSYITNSLSEKTYHRTVRSYVLRQGRITPAQERAIEQHWREFGIDYRPEQLDLDRAFGRPAPKILEIGAGTGENVVALAAAQRENDFLAVEVHRPGIGRLIRQAQSLQLTNIRVICHDAVDVLNRQIGDRTLEKILLFFPDPWPKKRHHKRRLIQPDTAALMSRKLRDHGCLYIATDWQDLAEHMLNTCDASPDLVNLAGKGCFSPRPEWRLLTKFEQRGRRLQHGVWDLAYSVRR